MTTGTTVPASMSNAINKTEGRHQADSLRGVVDTR